MDGIEIDWVVGMGEFSFGSHFLRTDFNIFYLKWYSYSVVIWSPYDTRKRLFVLNQRQCEKTENSSLRNIGAVTMRNEYIFSGWHRYFGHAAVVSSGAGVSNWLIIAESQLMRTGSLWCILARETATARRQTHNASKQFEGQLVHTIWSLLRTQRNHLNKAANAIGGCLKSTCTASVPSGGCDEGTSRVVDTWRGYDG